MEIKSLNHLLGNIDIYLLDQILKGRFNKRQKILDAGCGEGRNLVYFIRENYQVYGIDQNPDAIRMAQYLARSIDQDYPAGRFREGDVRTMPFEDQEFNVVLSSAVLHFAENADDFKRQFKELMRVLKQDGILFARLAALQGMEKKARPIGDGKYFLPDGSVRFLITETLLEEMMNEHGLEYIEPFKIVIVDNQRCMGTLVLKKSVRQFE